MNYLNLDSDKTQETVTQLNILLADYHIYYQKLRNFHWNVVGENFFDLHAKFEEMYNDTLIKIDELAERILTLRHQPESHLTRYLELSNIEESPSNTKDIEMIQILLEDHGKILIQMRKVVAAADQGGDEGTIDLLGAYIRELEKTSWMLDTWRMNKTENHQK